MSQLQISNSNQGTQTINLQKDGELFPASTASADGTDLTPIFTKSGWISWSNQEPPILPDFATHGWSINPLPNLHMNTFTAYNIESDLSFFNTTYGNLNTALSRVIDFDTTHLEGLSLEEELLMWFIDHEEINHIQPTSRQKVQLNIEDKKIAKPRLLDYGF